MDWESPKLLLLILPSVLLLLWVEQSSAHTMSLGRKRLLLVVRVLGVMLAIVALAGPAKTRLGTRQALGVIVDASQSLGEEGLARALAEASKIQNAADVGTDTFTVVFGDVPQSRATEFAGAVTPWDKEFLARHGGGSDYGSAVEFARSLFPAGTSQTMVVIGDGHDTRGGWLSAARDAAVGGVRMDAIGVSGPKRPDARVRDLKPSRSRLHEGASLSLEVTLDSTVDGDGVLKLYENGVEVDQRPVKLLAGQSKVETFQRTPNARDIYKYRATLEGITGDTMTANNDALAIVDVRGRLRLLYLEGDAVEGAILVQAMQKEGIELDLRQPGAVPGTLAQLAGYDGVILSDIAAHQVGEATMVALRDFVDKLGGGLLMLGGTHSFGLGGYVGTPVEDLLPVRLRARDEEEKQSAALALVIDRSGSMAGEKLEMAKSAAIATAEVLGHTDFLGVYAFDSTAYVVAPMTRLAATSAVAAQISTLAPGGGTNLQPAFEQARAALQQVKAKVKHMIVLTDGQTTGDGYEAMASQCRADGITISTVAIGDGSHVGLLQAIASAGGGQAYNTRDAKSITRIFTQDTLMHTGRMMREEPFDAVVAEKHPLLAGLEPWDAPPLLGYVKAVRKATAQVPLVTDVGDPLLAHWRFGLGKVTAFTSDAKSRWASLWISRWPSFSRFWSQVLRETARPPQGRRMDLACVMVGGQARVSVDLMADSGNRANDAMVQAKVFFADADALAAPLETQVQLPLGQSAPGMYEGGFRPEKPGIYLVQAQAGSEMVSAGLVYQPSTEVSLGTVDDEALRQVTAATGGRVLQSGEQPILEQVKVSEYVELWPSLIATLVALFLLDTMVRRWEHVQGLYQALAGARR
ncbi:MAG: VWA domain-containing protein [Verrucomicrobiaceae bacterium]|nr:VWA domain-containing protein [Verrucomicrobiaceae bacterium]